MSDLLAKQQLLMNSISKAVDNFKKFGKKNYTVAKIYSRITTLKENWQSCITGHAVLLRTFTDEQQREISYFTDEQLDRYEDIYQTTLDFMTEWLEELEPVHVSSNRSFAESTAIRSEPSALLLRHLPPIKLPPFSDNFNE